jgi:antitoxin (DNA-binding transcriptional repressor) of toxin-antitoxin stability system
VHQAKTNLSRLLEEAREGQEVIITHGCEPVARLVAHGAVRKNRVASTNGPTLLIQIWLPIHCSIPANRC